MKCEWSMEEKEIPFTWDLESFFWKMGFWGCILSNGWILAERDIRKKIPKTDSKFHIEIQRTQIATTTSRKKNKVGGLTLSDFNTNYKATVIKKYDLA